VVVVKNIKNATEKIWNKVRSPGGIRA